MPERLIGAVLKTVERASVPWVRIPPPPPFKTESEKALFFVTKYRCILLSVLVGSKINISWAFSPRKLNNSGWKFVDNKNSNWTKTDISDDY